MTGARRWPGALSALALGIFVALILAEGVLRVAPGLVASQSLKRELKWRRSRIPGNVLVHGRLPFIHSPELGWELRPGVRADGLTTNSVGLRGRAEYALERPPSVRRVIAVGDSFTFGVDLRDEDTMPAQLEAALNRRGRWEVLNLAVPGYGTDQQWLRLQQVGLRYAADVVVLGFFEGDLRRNVATFRDYAKPVFELNGDRLVLRNVPVPSPNELFARPMSGHACRVRLACAMELIEQGLAFDWEMVAMERVAAGRVTLAILDAMRAAVVGRGMQLVLVPIPYPMRPQPSTTEDLLVRWAERTGTPIVDTRRTYLAMPERDRARLYAGHWTPYGARVTAHLVAERVWSLADR